MSKSALRQCLTISCGLFVLIAAPVNAGAKRENKTETLKTYQDRLKSEEREKAELEEKAQSLDQELSGIKDDLVNATTRMRENEEEIGTLEQTLQELEARQDLVRGNLHKDRSSLSRLIVALERLRRVPPEAMLAKPDTPYETAQSALLMAEIAERIHDEALALKERLTELEEITRQKEERKNELVKNTQTLQSQIKEIGLLVSKREELYKETNHGIAARESEIQRLSLQSKNLEDLIVRLEEDRKRQEKKDRERQEREEKEEQERIRLAALQPKKDLHPPPQPKKIAKAEPLPTGLSPSQLPISGIIRVRYHENDDRGAVSNGLWMEGRPEALVLAPIGGKIQFAGAFKKYGNLIIIEHAKGYHSLVAGLDKINAVVGQMVSSGEPLGVLPNGSAGVKPRLYYELRHKGQPVNPSVLFSELS